MVVYFINEYFLNDTKIPRSNKNMKSRLILSIIILLIINNVIFAVDSESNSLKVCKKYLAINNMSGEKKWKELEKLLIQIREFGAPPGIFFEIMKDGTIISHDYRVKDIKKVKQGKIKIDYKRGYIVIPYLSKKKYHSFFIQCIQSSMNENDYSIQITFYVCSVYKEPGEGEHPFSSDKYLVIGANVKSD